MKKFLLLVLTIMLVLSFVPGFVAGLDNIVAYAEDTSSPLLPPGPSGAPSESDDPAIVPFLEPPYKLIIDWDEAGNKTASFQQYISPEAADGRHFEYNPGGWLLNMMINRLDDVDADYSEILLTLGNFSPKSDSPALLPYEGSEAGDITYTASFLLPDYNAMLAGEEYEGRTFPDESIEFVAVFPGGFTVRIPAGSASEGISSFNLSVYPDRIVVDFFYGDQLLSDVEAYIELPAGGTPVWIDSEGNEIEAEAEFNEDTGTVKLRIMPGYALAFKA